MSSARVFFPRFSRDELIDRLRSKLIELAAVLPLKEAVLFGSWARGRADVASDIDLLLIYEGEHDGGAQRTAWPILATPGLELHLYTETEAATRAETLSHMADEGVRLYP
ncbi:MAG: nucleotidyltransferase domain-containing protein [Trueperaceae bacterium]